MIKINKQKIENIIHGLTLKDKDLISVLILLKYG